MSDTPKDPKAAQTSSLTEVRAQKIQDLEKAGIPAYSVGFVPGVNSLQFKDKFGNCESFDDSEEAFSMAGRIMAMRVLGKSTFLRLRDAVGDFQAYLAREVLGAEAYTLIKKLDIGDIIGVRGKPFKTRTGELSILADEFQMLTKLLRPLPEKWHGLSDVETRYRQRYVDLIVNPEAREIVRTRSRIISYLRHFLTERAFWKWKLR